MSNLPPVLLGIQVLLYFYPHLNSRHRPGRWAEEWRERSRRLLDQLSAVPQLEVFVAQASLDYVVDFVKSASGSELAERFAANLNTKRWNVLTERSHLVSPNNIHVHELKLALEHGLSVITHERSEYLIPTDGSGVLGKRTVVQTVDQFLAWLERVEVEVQPVEPATSKSGTGLSNGDSQRDRA